jgi:ABC-type transport system substrate-binding protein
MDARPLRAAPLAALSVLAALATVGCTARPAARGTTCTWVVGRLQPAFDPSGPPDPVRWALERLLTRGLVDEDSSGALVPAAAEGWAWSADSLTLTFRLRPGLTFADGSACGSEDFRRALTAGLARTDHGSKAWLLAALAGVARVRAGRPLPPLGVEAPDERTLVLRLARRDLLLPAKLALPGMCSPWKDGPGGWEQAVGLGPYRFAREGAVRSLVLARRAGAAGPDTVVVRFQPSGARVMTYLRGVPVDLVWPLPASLAPDLAPVGYRALRRDADPPRTLWLVMRADLPPTSRLATRHALAHGVNRDRILAALGAGGRPIGAWLPGAGPCEAPALDAAQVREWMERGKLEPAFHVVLAFDADGVAASTAALMQGDWSKLGIYAELRPLRGTALARELLAGLSHLALVEAQPSTRDVAGTLAPLVMPLRGPAVGAFRTGWRTREFDGWLAPGRGASPADAEAAQARLREELVALPLARLPWTWLEGGAGAAVHVHSRYGPECAVTRWVAPPAPARGGDGSRAFRP